LGFKIFRGDEDSSRGFLSCDVVARYDLRCHNLENHDLVHISRSGMDNY